MEIPGRQDDRLGVDWLNKLIAWADTFTIYHPQLNYLSGRVLVAKARDPGFDSLGVSSVLSAYKMSDHLTLSLTIHWGCPLGFERLFCCSIWLCSGRVGRYTHNDCQPQCHQVNCHALKLSCEEPISIYTIYVCVCVWRGRWMGHQKWREEEGGRESKKVEHKEKA